MTDTFKLEVEYTDTYGGTICEWLRRETLTLPKKLSRRAIMRRAKAAMGLSGVRGRSSSHGDSWEFRPYGRFTSMFATPRY